MTSAPTSGIRAKMADLKRRKLLRLANKAEEATGAQGLAESIQDALTDDTRPGSLLSPSRWAKPMLVIYKSNPITYAWYKTKAFWNILFGRAFR